MGDAAGIGPEVVLKSLSEGGARSRCIIVGDLACLERTANKLSLPVDLFSWTPKAKEPAGGVAVYDLNNLPPSFKIGVDAAKTGRASGEYIIAAVKLWREGKIDAIATAPISKKAIGLGGYDFPGHTEFLAELTDTDKFAMSFFGGDLRVVLLSTHVSLRNAIELITADRLADLIKFTSDQMSRLLGKRVSIAVAGLNPHASEGGMFGHEEESEISPAVKRCRDEYGIEVTGPYSPDTVFLRAARGEFDAVIALYHDQATIPVKSLSFGSAVNVTLGLPLVRTSVDHGTAFDIAGKGVADPSSLKAAISLAGELVLSSQTAK
jgi:4-hydroxythreonine-4-phosphate dehydrogenase